MTERGATLTTARQALQLAQRNLPIVHFAADSALWVVGVPFAVWLRYDFDATELGFGVIVTISAAVGLQAIVGLILGQYRSRWRYGTFDEARVVALTAAVVGSILTVMFWSDPGVPRSVPILATGISLFGQIAVRSVWRLYKAHRAGHPIEGAKRLLVMGAGEGAEQVLRTLLATPRAPFVPVAMLDDDPANRQLRLSGVRVRGQLCELEAVARQERADAVLIAIPNADGSLIRTITAQAEAIDLDVYVLPPVDRILGGVDVGDIRPVEHADLLGRHPADIDSAVVAGYVAGRRVLVTGAGGSIGSEICRQLTRFEPSALMMLDRDESGLHSTQLSIEGRALLDNPNLILADIRDEARVHEVFAAYRPEVVFHTAALKHQPLLESHPSEGWKTNVRGTLNLLQAAAAHGVDRFVNVSTDKAADPISVLGWTKRITERLTAWANSLGDTVFVSVRFGNVLGSSGSVLKAFESQADNGGPITVTHPDITRFFMTIEEASRLVVHAGAIGEPGEVMILDMGEPVRIVDVARRFAERHDPPLEIVFTGLRSNEKLHETLTSADESGVIRDHPLISHVTVPPLRPTDLMMTGSTASIEEMASIAQSRTHRGAPA